MKLRGLLSAAVAALILALSIATGLANAYPDRPIRLVHGYASGASTDIVARLFAERLAADLGQQVIVDPKPGAGANIAMESVAKAKPDGYTLMLATSPNITINPYLYPHLSFDPSKDFAPVAMLHTGQNILVVQPSLPINSLSDLIQYAKAKPNRLTYGTSGPGSYQHLSGELFQSMTGAQIVHVPYKGGTPARNDFLAGQISMMFTDTTSIPYIKEGKMRAIAWNGSKRNPLLPNIPTMVEAGMPEFSIEGYNMIVAPTGTPHEIIETLNRSIVKAIADPALRQKLFDMGFEPPENTSPEYLQARNREEAAKWSEIIKSRGIKLE